MRFGIASSPSQCSNLRCTVKRPNWARNWAWLCAAAPRDLPHILSGPHSAAATAATATTRLLRGPAFAAAGPVAHRTRVVARMSGSEAAAASSPPALLSTKTFFLDNFALRQWDDPNYGGTRVSYDKAAFIARIQEEFDKGAPLVDGYAPFCKHVFVPNFVGAKLGALEITDANRHLLRSGYTKRRPEELAVLTRWFTEGEVEVPAATHLDIILYSREQLVKEYAAMPTKAAEGADPEALLPQAPWGIISIKAQDESYETPMQPITMMRNSLGREEGGSGVPLDREAYDKAVQYWETHATIVAGARPNGE